MRDDCSEGVDSSFCYRDSYLSLMMGPRVVWRCSCLCWSHEASKRQRLGGIWMAVRVESRCFMVTYIAWQDGGCSEITIDQDDREGGKQELILILPVAEMTHRVSTSPISIPYGHPSPT